MKKTTINQLIKLNQDFYQQTAQSFSDSRSYFWTGWQELLPFVGKIDKNVNSLENQPEENKLQTPLRILDLGCGNARFAEFLANNIPDTTSFRYYGWDNSMELLNLAQQKIAENILDNHQLQLHPQTSFVLDLSDIAHSSFPPQLQQEEKFNFITLFGILHHLPSAQLRLQLLQIIANQLQPHGFLIFSLWQFMKDDRLKARVLSPQEFPSNITSADLESNDYLLDWKRGEPNNALRYCHNFTEDEIADLVNQLQATTNLQLIHQFTADGPPQNPLNTYLVFQN